MINSQNIVDDFFQKQVNENSLLNLTLQLFFKASQGFVVIVFVGPIGFSRSSMASDGPLINQSDCELQHSHTIKID